MLNQKSVLIAGGTGFLGRALVRLILKRFPRIKRLIIFSRDELKQYEMAQEFPASEYPAMRFVLGDVRDYERLGRVSEGVDYLIHAAALKHVPVGEQHPMEYVKTNILGTENMINVALTNRVKRMVVLSTDKAVAPLSLYGATKLSAEKLVVAANYQQDTQDTRLSIVRLGNILGSYGSVVPFFRKQKEAGVISITDDRMTRFNMSPSDGADMVLWALNAMEGGEIFVPKLPSYRLIELAEAVAPGCTIKATGARPGEKLHEELISEAEVSATYDLGSYYAILPLASGVGDKYMEQKEARRVPEGFQYRSNSNSNFLSVEQLKRLTNEA